MLEGEEEGEHDPMVYLSDDYVVVVVAKGASQRWCSVMCSDEWVCLLCAANVFWV